MTKEIRLISISSSFKLFLSIILFSEFVFASQLDEKIINKINNINSQALKKDLRSFVSCCRPNRMVGSPGHLKARNWLIEKVNSIKGDGIVHVDSFVPDYEFAINNYRNDFKEKIANRFPPTSHEYQLWKKATDNFIGHLEKRKNIEGKNIIWEKKGRKNPDEILIVGAHYDTVAQDKITQLIEEKVSMPGADDNGSGVVLALKLIELLGKINLDKTIIVVFFDFQELGFLGSHAYLKKYKSHFEKKNLSGFINLLMLGHDSKRTDALKKEGNMKVYLPREGLVPYQKSRKLFNNIHKFGSTAKINFSMLANSFEYADSVNFWNNGFPALVYTQDWENDYNEKRHHTPNDFPETLNFNTLYQSYQYLAKGILGWNFSS